MHEALNQFSACTIIAVICKEKLLTNSIFGRMSEINYISSNYQFWFLYILVATSFGFNIIEINSRTYLLTPYNLFFTITNSGVDKIPIETTSFAWNYLLIDNF